MDGFIMLLMSAGWLHSHLSRSHCVRVCRSEREEEEELAGLSEDCSIGLNLADVVQLLIRFAFAYFQKNTSPHSWIEKAQN